MIRCAAFLRGMNLGRRRLTNEALQAAFEALGFAHAQPFRASGNVIFDDPGGGDLERRLEAGLRAQLGYEVPTYVRTGPELAALAAFDGLPAVAPGSLPGKLQVALLRTNPSPEARDAALALATEADRLVFGERALFWLPAPGVGRSELDWTALDRLLGAATVRTMGTIEEMSRRVNQGG